MTVPICLKAGGVSSWCVRSMDILFQLFTSSRTTQDDHTHVNNSTLTITNIELLDGGVYSCSAGNGVPHVEMRTRHSCSDRKSDEAGVQWAGD